VQTVISRLKATILCIDDHWSGLIGRKMLLESNGYEVLAATGGDEGLRLFLSHSVNAVVLDYQMPGMNGDVVAARMKRVKPDVPIMLLSSYGPLPTSKLEAVDIFLSKSQPPKILLSTLQQLLNRRPRPFFSRWFETWRSRNEGVRP
jgi:CheY-like chemotaxis protein